MDGRRYWAFLSYSHQDRAWARWLHRALETFPVPRHMVGRATPIGPAPRRLSPVFRDREELVADANLREQVGDALERSGFLIVICSPAGARSAWVNDEVARFKALHGETRVLAVIVAGSPHASEVPGREDAECFPPALRTYVGSNGAPTHEPAEPVAADLRPRGDGRRLALLKLVAPMLGVGLDDLAHRDAQRRLRQAAALSTVMGATALVMTGLAVAALVSRNEARHQRGEAEQLVEFMLTDLRKKLEPEGRLDALGAVATQAMDYYVRQETHGMDADALGRRARVLHLLGDIDATRGDTVAALAQFEQAAATTKELLARDPNNPHRLFEHAQSVFWVGEIAWRRHQSAVAEKQFREYLVLADRLLAAEPAKQDWLAEVGYANTDLGAVLLQVHRVPESLPILRRAVSIDQTLVERSPKDLDRKADLAGALGWLADAESLHGEADVALGDTLAEQGIYQALLAQRPGDHEIERELVANQTRLARLQMDAGHLPEALAELKHSTREADRLVRFDAADLDYREEVGWAYSLLAEAHLRDHHEADAEVAIRRASILAQSLAGADPTVGNWSGSMLGGVRVLDIEIAASGARDRASCLRALAPAATEAARLEGLASGRPHDMSLARAAAEASLLAGDRDAIAGQTATARAAWSLAGARITAIDDGALTDLDPKSLAILRASQASMALGQPTNSTSAVQAHRSCGRIF